MTDTTDILNESIEELVGSLTSQIGQLQQWIKCRHIKTTQEDKDELEQIEKRITKLELTVSAMDNKISRDEESLIFVERMLECIQLNNKKIAYLNDNKPDQLPVISERNQNISNTLSSIINHNNNKENVSLSSLSSIPVSSSSISNNEHNNYNQFNNNNNNNNKRKAPSLDDNPRATKRRRINNNNNNNNNNQQNKNKKNLIPQIEIISSDEFNSVPKYVRGRLTQKRVNDGINEYNQELINKYRLMQIAASKMTPTQYDLHDKYLSEETKETKHLYWLSYDNFKYSKNITMDNTGKAIFNVIRHLKRIKMISGKKPKYVVL